MNNPYSEPSKTEHPSRTAYFERLMAEVEPTRHQSLAIARQRLVRAKNALDDQFISASEPDFLLILQELGKARAEVARLEKEAIR